MLKILNSIIGPFTHQTTVLSTSYKKGSQKEVAGSFKRLLPNKVQFYNEAVGGTEIGSNITIPETLSNGKVFKKNLINLNLDQKKKEKLQNQSSHFELSQRLSSFGMALGLLGASASLVSKLRLSSLGLFFQSLKKLNAHSFVHILREMKPSSLKFSTSKSVLAASAILTLSSLAIKIYYSKRQNIDPELCDFSTLALHNGEIYGIRRDAELFQKNLLLEPKSK